MAYECSECGKRYSKYVGVCSGCGEFSSLQEAEPDGENMRGHLNKGVEAVSRPSKRLSDLDEDDETRIATGINELDRVLGGGFVDSEVALIGGEPGAGKSTLSMRLSEAFAEKDMRTLYISGEESARQIKLRADRMGVDNDLISVVHTTSLEEALGHIESERPEFFIVDSLQAMVSSNLSSQQGSIQQSTRAAHDLQNIAKELGLRAFLVNQVNKSGEFAGSEAIQHLVDVLLFLESREDTPLKYLRARKNRFGSTDEVGIFQHGPEGLEEVFDPSGILLDNKDDALAPGTAYGIISEGIRQVPVEVQALVAQSSLPSPRRQFNGVQHNRGQIVCAILEKHCNLRLSEDDVFASTMFGVNLHDPQSDLATAAAIICSKNDVDSSKRTVFVGELSLTGQVRGVHQIQNKINEAERSGFDRIIVPSSSKNKVESNGIELDFVGNVKGLVKIL